jgi:hypothetical protein
VPVGRGDDERAVAAGHDQTAVVDEAVVGVAQQDEVGHVGAATEQPVPEVMGMQALMRFSRQPGRAQPPSRRSRALRWASVARRFRRPTASGSRSFSSMATTVAPHSIRRTCGGDSAGPPST